MRIPARMFSVLALSVALSACTTTHVGTDRLAERDPLEGFNRGVWAVNRGADKIIIKPVATVYRTVTPKPARDGVRNFFANVGEPFSFINNVLQGKFKRAGRNIERFVVNTTIGIGGLFDHASRMKIRPAEEDFGQTLAAWGANGGPYLMLPLFGPSTMRDAVGLGVAQFADPYRVCLTYCGLPHRVPLALTVAQVISIRNDLIDNGADNFLESSLDPYAATRSAYLQRRHAEILNQDDDAGGSGAGGAGIATDAGAPSAADADAGIPASSAASAADADAGIPSATPPATPATAPPPEAPKTPQ